VQSTAGELVDLATNGIIARHHRKQKQYDIRPALIYRPTSRCWFKMEIGENSMIRQLTSGVPTDAYQNEPVLRLGHRNASEEGG
jgi:hypothetical protein